MIGRVRELPLTALANATNLLQSELWARFKSEFRWNVRAFTPDDGPWADVPLLTLTRAVAPGVSLCYVPYAPPDAGVGADALGPLGRALLTALEHEPVCVRFDLPWDESTVAARATRRVGVPERDGAGELVARGPVRAPVDVQPRSTVVIDLSRSQEELLGDMHKKNRYNIGLSERKGVRVRDAGVGDLEHWYGLYRETAARDRITIHPLRYYRRLFDLASADAAAAAGSTGVGAAGGEPAGGVSVHLYLAEHEDDLLAGVIVAHFAGMATYLYGASSDRKRNLMPNYALQWHAMERAREAGMRSYDLFGVPPADDPRHPLHGLYRFKVGFGGALIHRAGCWDVIGRPARYGVYRLAERARSFYFHRLRKAGAR